MEARIKQLETHIGVLIERINALDRKVNTGNAIYGTSPEPVAEVKKPQPAPEYEGFGHDFSCPIHNRYPDLNQIGTL